MVELLWFNMHWVGKIFLKYERELVPRSYSGMWFEWLIYRQEAVLWKKKMNLLLNMKFECNSNGTYPVNSQIDGADI